MYKAYKWMRPLFFCISLGGALFFIFKDYPEAGYFDMVLPALIWIFAVWLIMAFVVGVIDAQKVKLINECRPAAFIAHASKFIHTLKDNAHRTMYLINLFVAFYDLGETDKAEAYLSLVKANFPNNLNGQLLKHAYHIDMSTLHMTKGELDLAEAQLEAAAAVLSSDRLNPAVKANMALSNQVQRYELNMCCGNYEGAEEFFENWFHTQKILRNKVASQYTLAEIYKHKCETEKALEACRYVIANGGETRYVRLAQAMLEDLEN